MAMFAANLTMLFTEVPFIERFEQAHQAGFKAVEFLFPYAYEAQQLANQLHQFDLKQALFNMPPGDWDKGERGLAAIPGREAEFAASIELALDYAQALNCKKVHAMAGLTEKKFTRQQHIETFIANIRLAADRLAEFGIEVMIEPLNDRDVPGYFISHQREAVNLIKQIDRANVKLQLDLYHAQIMDGNLTHLIRELACHVGHVQIASVPDRHEPSEGELNYPYLFEILDQSGYQSWIGCEYHPKHTTERGLNWLNDYQ